MRVDFRSAPSGAKARAASHAASAEQESTLLTGGISAFARELVRTTRPGPLIFSGILVLLSAVTEGVSLVLLIPLVQLVGDSQGQKGWIEASISRALDTIGVPLSLPALLLAFVGLVAARASLLAMRDVALVRLRIAFADALREEIYRDIAGSRWSFLMRQRFSDLFETLTSHVEGISVGAYSLLRLPAVAIVGAIQVAIAFIVAPALTAGVVCWGGLVLVAFRRRTSRQHEQGRRLFDAQRASFAEISDFLHALKLAKGSHAEARHVAAFEASIKRQSVESIAFGRSDATIRMMTQIAAAISLGIVVYLAASVVHIGTANLIVLIVIFARLSPLVSDLQQGWESVARTLPVFYSVVGLRKCCIEAAEPIPAGLGRVDVTREIRLANVGFRYDKDAGTGTLENVSLVIAAATTVAIVGRTGAGKSTIADLLLGLVMPDSGSVLIDGMPLTAAMMGKWRRSVGYVPQDNFLFNDTVRANLLWACPDASQEDILRALSIAAAEEFVTRLPRGLDTLIGERGLRLSGGERQRLCLARAVLCRPTLLILDEATSALDHQTERAVQAAIERLHGSMTIVIIAHRLSTIRGADRIFVLEHAKLVQEGPWETLCADRQGAFNALLDKPEQAVPS